MNQPIGVRCWRCDRFLLLVRADSHVQVTCKKCHAKNVVLVEGGRVTNTPADRVPTPAREL